MHRQQRSKSSVLVSVPFCNESFSWHTHSTLSLLNTTRMYACANFMNVSAHALSGTFHQQSTHLPQCRNANATIPVVNHKIVTIKRHLNKTLQVKPSRALHSVVKMFPPGRNGERVLFTYKNPSRQPKYARP